MILVARMMFERVVRFTESVDDGAPCCAKCSQARLYSHPTGRAITSAGVVTGELIAGAVSGGAQPLVSPRGGASVGEGAHKMASPMPASWNQIVGWLKQIEGVRQAA
jgi:hypothetical protein